MAVDVWITGFSPIEEQLSFGYGNAETLSYVACYVSKEVSLKT